MNDVIDPETGLPLRFPDSATEAYACAGVSSVVVGGTLEADRGTDGDRHELGAQLPQAC